MKRGLKITLIIIMDVLLTGASLIVFALFHHVLKAELKSEDVKIESTENIKVCESSEDDGIFACTCKTQKESTETKYVSENIRIEITTYNEPKLIYHIADVHVKNIESIQTVFAKDSYGKGFYEWPHEIDKRSNALLTVNGDYYGLTSSGVIIRNGTVYRSSTNKADIGVLFRNGELKTYTSSEFNMDDVVSKGAYQAWNFGPALLDANGKALTEFPSTTVIPKNPRSAIGYYEPGHYVFVNVEGRTDTSDGMTMAELSSLFEKLGCKSAYNLDGGQSAMMVFNDKFVNNLCEGGRTVSDVIVIKEVANENNN